MGGAAQIGESLKVCQVESVEPGLVGGNKDGKVAIRHCAQSGIEQGAAGRIKKHSRDPQLRAPGNPISDIFKALATDRAAQKGPEEFSEQPHAGWIGGIRRAGRLNSRLDDQGAAKTTPIAR